ncbi:serine dehydratase beta chain [Streptomyces sp. NPDC000678]|uniref:serine dehydratase beta chain n=1 Tax=Streptomyces sp. NPDC000678 TaxID=3154268 RepID=UPI0031D4BDE6
MAVSVFDLFSIGIGPSSSHTVGPMRAARQFIQHLTADGLLAGTARLHTQLFGSLGATGHGTPKAVMLGLEGHTPDSVDVDQAELDVERITRSHCLHLASGAHTIDFNPDTDVVLHRRRSLPHHPNGMTLTAHTADGQPLLEKTYYSVGGGFVIDEESIGADRVKPDTTLLKYPFFTDDDSIIRFLLTAGAIGILFKENASISGAEGGCHEGRPLHRARMGVRPWLILTRIEQATART